MLYERAVGLLGSAAPRGEFNSQIREPIAHQKRYANSEESYKVEQGLVKGLPSIEKDIDVIVSALFIPVARGI